MVQSLQINVVYLVRGDMFPLCMDDLPWWSQTIADSALPVGEEYLN